MNNQIDCLLIGHNEMEFADYEAACRHMGVNNGSYRDLNLNFIWHEDKPFTVTKIFNLLNESENLVYKPLEMVEAFSSTISYLGSFLNRHDLSFEFVNSFQENKNKLKDILTHSQIETIAILTTLYVVPLPIIEIVRFIKQYNETAKIVIGGPFVSTKIRSVEPEALGYLWETIGGDYFINSSQGEATLVKLIKALKSNSPVDNIENLHHKVDGMFEANPVKIEDNKLPENSVNWNLFSHAIEKHVNDRTAISCAFSCSFCGFPEHAGKYQTTQVDWIERQLNHLNSLGTVESVHFIDDTFNVPMRRFKDICRVMIRNKYDFNWHSYCRCQYLDVETVELMKESGCEGVFLGIESGNPQILKNMNKKSTVEQYRDRIALLKKYGITTFGSFITGFPGETDETVKDTINFIQESGLDFYRTQLWYCDPITPIIRNETEKYKIEGESFEWVHATMDSKTACNWVDEMFLKIDNAVWIPQYDFDFASLWYLVHRGIPIEKVKEFLNSFANGIKEKFKENRSKNVSSEVLKQLSSIFHLDDKDSENGIAITENATFDKYEASFDY
jgi:radical SAM PhpK family P-methyltransferase